MVEKLKEQEKNREKGVFKYDRFISNVKVHFDSLYNAGIKHRLSVYTVTKL